MSINNMPAFPAPNFIVPENLEAKHIHRLGETQGMTLRDYFAAHAPQSAERMGEWVDADQRDAIYRASAENAYRWADAMLAERVK